MTIAGVWDVTIATSIGRQIVELVMVDTGVSKAGRLPSSKVTGVRRSLSVEKS